MKKVRNIRWHTVLIQYTGIVSASSSADPVTSGAWQGSHRNTSLSVTGMTRPTGKAGIGPRSSNLEADAIPPGHQIGFGGNQGGEERRSCPKLS